MAKKDYGLQPHEFSMAEAVLSMKSEGKTFTQIAEEHGISRRQLQNIRAKDEFKRYLKERSIEQAADKLPDVLEALYHKAVKEKNVKAMELYIRVADAFPSDKVEVTNHQPRKDLSNDELYTELESLKLVVDNDR